MKICANITLELSLKPFKQTSKDYIDNVCKNLFEQWKPLVKDAEKVNILLWVADGSEILDYTGVESDEFEWCKYMGSANPETDPPEWDPAGETLSSKNKYYIDNPPVMTYKTLKTIVQSLKEIGRQVLGKDSIGIGETFDIGPEFARSSFKYYRHREICYDGNGNTKCFINCFGKLNEDNYNYKSYPNGVKQGTSFVELFAKQCKAFFDDMGFDFLWLSNGVGFSQEPWDTKGAIFDGKRYHIDKLQAVKDNMLKFWTEFRKYCPDYMIQVRGTNFSVGIDYATDAVPLWDLYNGNFNMLPPPNSPWAALDGNFGLELVGYMTRMAEIPDSSYLFRFYLHDPWWVNSPWYDRYEGQPHDIYLPMAVSRLDKNGTAQIPDYLNVFTIDNSYGELPEQCAVETIPHFKRAYKEAPDAPAPFVWVYPFREYTNSNDEYMLKTMFANDWFVCKAINDGFPLSSIISTDNFITSNKENFNESIVFSPIPTSKEYEDEILKYVLNGGRVFFYGSVDSASERFLNVINIKLTDNNLSGKLKINRINIPDEYLDNKYPDCIDFKADISCGSLNTLLAQDGKSQAVIYAGDGVIATGRDNCVWYRAPLSASYVEGMSHLKSDNSKKLVLSEQILRKMLSHFGYVFEFVKESADIKSPAIMVNRNDNGFFFSIYSPNTTVISKLKFPMGAPLITGFETIVENSVSRYCFSRSEHRECRVFVNQQEKSIVSCTEYPPVSATMRRRILITGLKNADVVFYPEKYCTDSIEVLQNSNGAIPATSEKAEVERVDNHFIIKNVSGQLILSMPAYNKEN